MFEVERNPYQFVFLYGSQTQRLFDQGMLAPTDGIDRCKLEPCTDIIMGTHRNTDMILWRDRLDDYGQAVSYVMDGFWVPRWKLIRLDKFFTHPDRSERRLVQACPINDMNPIFGWTYMFDELSISPLVTKIEPVGEQIVEL